MTDVPDDPLRRAAQHYHEPPETPRDAIWARIEASRRAPSPPAPIPIERHPRWRRWIIPIGIAAMLAIGIAIGRMTVSNRSDPAQTAAVTAPDSERHAERRERAMRLVTSEHLSRVETLLTDFKANPGQDGFTGQARTLLTTTQLILDAKQLGDPKLRGLLEDLELVLVQIAHLPATESASERALINEGMAERQLRVRLRNAIPAGPAVL